MRRCCKRAQITTNKNVYVSDIKHLDVIKFSNVCAEMSLVGWQQGSIFLCS